MFGANGLVNQLLGALGFTGMPGWVSNPDTALGTLILLNVWTFGSPMIIFLAGLRQIPQMYYEAASVDGASKVKQFFTITIPLLTRSKEHTSELQSRGHILCRHLPDT